MEPLYSDIVIVGAGLAGFTAAVRAAERGAQVLLVDKSNGELGDGNVLMASGSLRAGGKSPKTDAKELHDFVMSEGVAYPDLVKSWSATCSRAIDWLPTVGVAIEETAPGRIWLQQESEISYGPVYKKDVGPRAIASLKKQFLKLGGRYMNGMEGVRLIVENNRVVGLVGKQNGREIELRSRATILSTGGFSANKELVKRYIGSHADRCKLRGSKQDTGDGLRMALEVGAKAVNLKYFYGHLIARKALSDDRFWPYPRLDSFVDEGMLVNATGQRFVDEGRGDVAVANDLARSDDPTGATLIFDRESWAASKDNPSSASLKIPAPNPWIIDNGAEIFSHETVEGLAQALGIDRAKLKKTVEDYNRAVETNDAKALTVTRTGKPKALRAPLYGLRVVSGITFTMGGVAINGRAQVLNQEEKSIAGLFAAGDAIGGLMGGQRGGYTGGLMQAIVTGILAGESAAETK
ncbi:MAG: FAD-dependent oxidoreductase [Deltaproteobacteria bacterium]|nr:FAD-dependent oxidoreductase [Deltaproteobacteria bacterium]